MLSFHSSSARIVNTRRGVAELMEVAAKLPEPVLACTFEKKSCRD
ncbi:MAG: hypothetical protein ACKO0X_01775 [Bacteroidota bacterium]